MTPPHFLVIGGTGRTGRRIVDRLRDRDQPFRATSRYTGHPFDWHNPSTWDAALDGVTWAYYARRTAVTSIWNVPARTTA